MKNGHICNPINNTEDLTKAIELRSNTTLYCTGSFVVTDEMYSNLKQKNIKLGNA
jgi:hypothetical protein